MRILFLTILTLLSVYVHGQESFSVKINRDTVFLGNSFQLSYEIANIDGDFKAPDLSDLTIISGPNTSMSMSIMNGQSKKTSTYSYTILPELAGAINIDPATCITRDSVYSSSPISVIVVENPDGIIQEDNHNSFGFDGFFNMNPWGQQNGMEQKQKPAISSKRKMKRI